MAVSKTLEPHWSLFEDWCEAFGRPALPASADTIIDFLRAFPSGVPTNTLRVRAIRHEHSDNRVPLDLDALRSAAKTVHLRGLDGPRTLVRHGDGSTRSVGEALAQLPTAKYPAGLRGRRNGVIVVLALVASMTRRAIHGCTPHDVVVHDGTVWVSAGAPGFVAAWPPETERPWVPVPRGNDAGSCPACALYRWGLILPMLDKGNRGRVKVLLNHYRFDPDDHACDGENPFTADFYAVPSLTAALDQHGWAETRDGLSLRTISSISASAQEFSGEREQAWAPREVKTSRFDGMSTSKFAEVMDDFDRKVAEALAASSAVLDDAHDASESMYRMLGHEVG